MGAKPLKPMLAYNKDYDLNDLTYPLLASLKLDGIRCIIKDGKALSRSLIPIPNLFVQRWVEEHSAELEGLDGELIVGDRYDPHCMSNTNSGVMSINGEPDFHYWVFDLWDMPDASYRDRHSNLEVRVEALQDRGMKHLMIVPQTEVNTAEEAASIEEREIAAGAEGIILRSPDALYKFGRSTLKEQGLLKRKAFVDLDCTVTGVIEAVKNDNEAETDNLGRTKRSHAQSGRTEGKGYLGAFEIVDENGRKGRVGMFRLSQEEKTEIWENRDAYIGRKFKAKVMEHGGINFPRHATFIVWRHEAD